MQIDNSYFILFKIKKYRKLKYTFMYYYNLKGKQYYLYKYKENEQMKKHIMY